METPNHPDCHCGHPVGDHHLEHLEVECWGELAYVVDDGPVRAQFDCGEPDRFFVLHCDCECYQPVLSSLNRS